MLGSSFRACVVAAVLSAPTIDCAAAVHLEKLNDRVRVEIDGRFFTEYRFQEWNYPYLYPVHGPNAVSVTRHFPMTTGIKGEQQDHPHHRSMFFTHSHVNGWNFWAPQAEARKGRKSEIKLERIEKARSGDQVGELIVWNQWLGDGKLILRERRRFTFESAGDGQVLMDFDVELHAVEQDVTFADNKDGGLGIRVAGPMKVRPIARHAKDNPGFGAIVNSRGDKNDDAWGKAAEWVDYSGPDASGKTVGIAIFDHPSNFRAPARWHARYYGLLTANRFAAGSFGRVSGAKKGEGDHTIKAGESLKIRHRFYFHHGDASAGRVAEKFAKYAAEPSAD